MQTPRPRCSVFIAVSLDGYIARPDGGIDWLHSVDMPGEDYGYNAFFESVDVVLLGRNSYDVVLGFSEWYYGDKRCVVLTHRPGESRHGEEFYSGDVKELVQQLAESGVRRIYVDGGKVIQQFLDEKLIDDLTISVIPILLGDGIRLFASGSPEQRLVLEGTQSWSSGLTQLRYRVETP